MLYPCKKIHGVDKKTQSMLMGQQILLTREVHQSRKDN
jgi:hypothetical protein